MFKPIQTNNTHNTRGVVTIISRRKGLL